MKRHTFESASLNGFFAAIFPFVLRVAPLVLMVVPAASAADASGSEALISGAPVRVYSHLMEPRDHPDYDRRPVKPPGWDVFKNRTQFTTLRGFNVEKDSIVGYEAELEKFTRTHALGDVIWPSYPILFATNLDALCREIKRRDLYLFDVWGYVPGSGPGGYWQQFQPPKSAFETMESILGERWLGTDIGEQDGRYIGGYANQMTPSSAGRFEQYLNFQRHFERMGDDLGHKHATLVSLNFGHYFLKEGTYTAIGAETAQGLPNSQVYYAFIRGAGKQYGVPWFGNASIYNRWGFKTYGSSGKSDGYEFGPTKGSSLSLLKRLLYSHILYNSVTVGFENMWFEGEKLSPIGRIQQSAQRWVKENGQPGAFHAPVALLLDFNCGWSFPRHLYTDKLYRVWGNLPYESGDFLTDAVLDMIYPGYANASYYHDETGFLTPTPYGDVADALLSDAPAWVLKQYAVVIAAGDIRIGAELRAKLTDYVDNGGHLVLTPANLARFPSLWGGVTPPSDAPGVSEFGRGKGHVTVIAGPAYGLKGAGPDGKALTTWSNPDGGIDRPLPKPYLLTEDARFALDKTLRSVALFEAGEGLHLITCRKGPGNYTLGVFNNTWRSLPLKIVSHCGPIQSLRELPLDTSEIGAPGYAPENVNTNELGATSATSLAGGDVRIFAVQVAESNVLEVAYTKPPARPRGRLLPLRRLSSIKEEILARPTFFEHFDGVIVDALYLRDRESATLAAEAPWLKRQGLRIVADLSSSIDLYPRLRLIDNATNEYQSSMATIRDVFAKMRLMDSHDLIFSLHRHPENNFTGDETKNSFNNTLKQLASEAATLGITLHLRLAPGKPPWGLADAAKTIDQTGAPNLKLAPSTALLWHTPGAEETALLRNRIGIWLAAAPLHDPSGALWNAHAQVGLASDRSCLAPWFASTPGVPIALDALLENPEQEYSEATSIEALMHAR